MFYDFPIVEGTQKNFASLLSVSHGDIWGQCRVGGAFSNVTSCMHFIFLLSVNNFFQKLTK